MAKQITGNYYYMNESGEIIHDSHPGKDKKTGHPKPPGGSKTCRCWTEVGLDVWHYPNGTIKAGSRLGETYAIPVVEDDKLVLILNRGWYHSVLNRSQLEKCPCDPFWRYAIAEEWKESWQEEWADRSVGNVSMDWWRAEIRAFLSIVKDLSGKGVELGEGTQVTIEYIKKYFGKKKEEIVAQAKV